MTNAITFQCVHEHHRLQALMVTDFKGVGGAVQKALNT